MEALTSLARLWIEEAEVLARYHDERGAEVCRLHATELIEALRSREREVLTLSEAAEESGYSVDHLRHLVADGTITNAGRKGSPRIHRGDLPVKPGASAPVPTGFDPDQEAEAILAGLD